MFVNFTLQEKLRCKSDDLPFELVAIEAMLLKMVIRIPVYSGQDRC